MNGQFRSSPIRPIDHMNISVRRDSITGKEFSIDATKHINISGISGMGKSTLPDAHPNGAFCS